MPSDTLQVEIADGVALLTLNRPDSLNALNRELFAALMEALHQVRDEWKSFNNTVTEWELRRNFERI